MPRVSRFVRRTIVELFLMRIGLIATYQRQIRCREFVSVRQGFIWTNTTLVLHHVSDSRYICTRFALRISNARTWSYRGRKNEAKQRKRSRRKSHGAVRSTRYLFSKIKPRRVSIRRFYIRAEHVPSAVSKTIKCVSAEHELVLLKFHC